MGAGKFDIEESVGDRQRVGMNHAHGELRVGTSGFHYNHWRGVFYPDHLSPSKWFDHYAQAFDTVELNNTFYRLPSSSVFKLWRRQAPAGFLYAVKFNRYGSHWMRLKNPRGIIGNFLQGAKKLDRSLGPILVQLPPRWSVNGERLNGFLRAAPPTLRWALEFRDPSWLCAEVYGILKHHNAALCIHDMIPNHPRILTADWTYLRYHGQRYSGSYSPQKLAAEARWIRRRLASGNDVFAYFNNDAQGFAVSNAVELKRYSLKAISSKSRRKFA
jgi:uncharacterized protein YecE (DUF72 family)